MKKFSFMVPIGYLLYAIFMPIAWIVAFFVGFNNFIQKNPGIAEDQRLNEFSKQIQGNTIVLILLGVTILFYVILWFMVLIQAGRLDRKTALLLYIIGLFVPICSIIGFFIHLFEIRNTNKRIETQK